MPANDPQMRPVRASSENAWFRLRLYRPKRKAFKELVAALRSARPKRRRPSLRLVVSNPKPSVVKVVAAAQGPMQTGAKAGMLGLYRPAVQGEASAYA